MLADAQRSCYVHQRMNTRGQSSKAQACGAQVGSETPARAPCRQIKLAMDVHAASIAVGRMTAFIRMLFDSLRIPKTTILF